MSYYTLAKPAPSLHSIYDPMGAYCYLIEGQHRALLFDAVYGVSPLRDVVARITPKPYEVVLGHGHIDHVNGAHEYNEVWLHESDFDLFKYHASAEFRTNIVNGMNEKLRPAGFDAQAYISKPPPRLKALPIGHVFDLGGEQAEVVAMEGHTAGSMGLLLRNARILLNSDAANPHIWMFLNESLPTDQYIAMLERTIQLPFDTFYAGHSGDAHPKADMEKYIQVARNATLEKAKPYNNGFEDLKPHIYEESGMAIVIRGA
ncbi:MAG: MBL fold metallo-hydrolase [Defluviitaleaceae bacterium]|nr:MBL fold metallo-hydrolase [Defluviitaleaceae bacterium]MCL2275803.1 MBL fold metallo-hydrolase [Defluviitaleaceae bacterium]